MAVIGDANYEPPSREGAVIAALRAALTPGARGSIQLNSSKTTACGGVALSDRWVTRMEVLDAFNRLAHSETQQAAVLVLLHGQQNTVWEVSRQLHIDRNTVANEEQAGLQALVRLIWDEAGYESPLRMRPHRSVVGFVEREHRTRHQRVADTIQRRRMKTA